MTMISVVTASITIGINAMKTRNSLGILLLMAVAAVSCNKEPQLNVINFVANSTGFSDQSGTRTVFTGEKVGGVERIDWVPGDILRIYCGEGVMGGSSNTHFCDYTVTASSSSGSSVCTATINPASDLNGMQWGTGTHHFYAMYPSPDTEELEGVSFENGTMVFTMPAEQTVTRKENTGTWLPDMKYAPMLAYSTVEANASSVPLTFSPKYTAFTFTVNKMNYQAIHLREFTLSAKSGNLTGAYTISHSANGEYNAEISGVENGGQLITVDLNGVVMDAETPEFTLTVMAVPEALSGLTIGYSGDEIGTRTLALSYSNGTPLSFAAYKKFIIRGLTFPEGIVSLGRIEWDGSMTIAEPFSITWDGVMNNAGVDSYNWDGNTNDAAVAYIKWDN